jgi:hypothetical protein
MTKKQKPYCLRCGIDKTKGFYEGGCSNWGTYYKRHIWNIRIVNTLSKKERAEES